MLDDALPKYPLRTVSQTGNIFGTFAIVCLMAALLPLVDYHQVRLWMWPYTVSIIAAGLVLFFMSKVLDKQHQQIYETERNGITLERIEIILREQNKKV